DMGRPCQRLRAAGLWRGFRRLRATGLVTGREANMRRLITLISAGRNRMIVIRRELRLTEDAGSVQAPCPTKQRKALLSACPRPVAGAVSAKPIMDVAGGWQTSGIVTVQSGFPLSITTAGDIANAGTRLVRANVLRDWRLPDDSRGIAGYFDAGAFANP